MMNEDAQIFFRRVRDFLTVYLPKQKAASSHTIRSYRTAINQYLKYACAELNIRLSDYSFCYSPRPLLENFLEQLESRQGNSINSRNQRLAAIRCFYKYAADRDVSIMSCYQELAVIPVKKKADHEIEFFSELALEAILKEPDASCHKGLRDLIFMIILYDTGGRVQEILNLRMNDLHINSAEEKYVVLTGKGSKTRLVPLMQKTVDHLKKYIAICCSDAMGNSFLFYIDRNGSKNQMSQDNVSKFIKKYGMAAKENCCEVPDHLYAHMFRHSRAMHLYRNGMPLPLLSEWLGHAQMETTIKYYANADISMKQDAINRATSELNPLLSSQIEFNFNDDDETLKRLYGLT